MKNIIRYLWTKLKYNIFHFLYYCSGDRCELDFFYAYSPQQQLDILKKYEEGEYE